MSKELDLAKKLQALADAGVGGEKINAQEMLRRHMVKYGITEADLIDERVFEYNFEHAPEFDHLFHQVFSTIGDLKSDRYNKIYGRKNFVGSIVEVTHSELAELQLKFDVYSELLKQEQKIFFVAFIHANNIFHPEKINMREDRELTAEEKRALDLAKNIKTSEINKRIGNISTDRV